MVTLATVLVFIFLNVVIFIVDMTLFHYTFMEELGILYYLNPLFGRIMLYFMILTGFGSAIVIDIRRKRNKKSR
jgi:hypothetical protein